MGRRKLRISHNQHLEKHYLVLHVLRSFLIYTLNWRLIISYYKIEKVRYEPFTRLVVGFCEICVVSYPWVYIAYFVKPMSSVLNCWLGNP